MVMSLPTSQIFNEVLEGAGSRWKEENHPVVGRPLLSNKKPASSFKKVSFNYKTWQASKDTWQLNFAKTFALAAKEDLLFCWFREKKKKKKRNILQFHLNFLSPTFHKNKRWFFKVPVSALFDILIWFWPNNRPNPSGWILKICYDFHPSLPVLSLSQWQIVCFPSFFIFPPMGKTLLL